MRFSVSLLLLLGAIGPGHAAPALGKRQAQFTEGEPEDGNGKGAPIYGEPVGPGRPRCGRHGRLTGRPPL